MAVVDATGLGDPIFDDLRRVGVHARAFKFTNSSKKELIDRLCVVIEQRLITFPDIIELIDELKTYAYELTTARNIKYSAPEGMHDDCVISLGLAVWGCRNFLYNPKTLKENKKNKYRTQREENAGYGY